MEETPRFHVKNIPVDVSEAHLKKFFKSLGCVSDVTIKNDYGFFSVTCSSENVDDAIKQFSGRDWNGNMITLSRAKKDNFMARLAEERIAAKNVKPGAVSPIKTHDFKTPNGSVNSKRKFNDGSDSDSDDTKAGVPRFRGTKFCKQLENVSETVPENNTMQELAKFDSMWNDDEDESPATNLSSFLSKSTDEKPKRSPKVKVQITKQQKKLKDDERRRSSLANKEKERKRQQDLIKAALGTNDGAGPSSNKIRFSDNEDDSEGGGSERKLLFDDNDDSELKIPDKHVYEGASGSKLMSLQSQFNNDSRFKMDERFLEDSSEQQLERRRPNEMVRFDPKKQQNDQTSVPTAKEKNDKKPEPRPYTSQKKFYEVSENIKTALVQKAPGFSLLATYGGQNETIAEPTVEVAVPINRSRKNPFVCSDSSDDEVVEMPTTQEQPQSNLWNTPIMSDASSDKFFFADNDPLFAEAMEFMNKRNSDEAKAYAENYEQTRQVLRRIFKDQALRRAKKNDAFKKKVGGSKNTQVFKKKRPNNFSRNDRNRVRINGYAKKP